MPQPLRIQRLTPRDQPDAILRLGDIQGVHCSPLRAAQDLAPTGVAITIYAELGNLPPYNADVEDA